MRYEARERLFTAAAYLYVVACCVVMLLPFGVTFFRSITFTEGFPFVSIESYTNIVGHFWPRVGISVNIGVATVIVDVLVAIPAAYALTRYAWKARRLIYLILTAVWYIPGISYALALILAYYLIFIYRPLLGFWGYVAAYSCGFFPIMLMSCIVAFRQLDPSYEEAANCLGAGRLRTFLSVTLPLIGPGVTAGILLTFVLSFNEFVTALLLSGPTRILTAPVKVFDDIQHAGMHGFIAAEASVLQIVSFAACLIYLRVVGTRYLRGTILI